MNYILIGLAVSFGWHIVKLIYKLVEEILFTRLHATQWYAVLCKKQQTPIVQLKSNLKKDGDYKETRMGFLQKSA